MSFTTEANYIYGLKQEITFHIGKSASGNFDIIDNADENDLWFHVDNEPSSHVVANIPNNIDRKNVKYIIKQGAILCKQNSKFKKSKMAVNIIYTRVKNVSKTNIIGKVEISEGKIVTV